MEMKAGKYSGWLKKYSSSDVIIVGSGPAGLIAAMDLARLDLKALIIERDNYAGGRLWQSDFLINTSASAPQLKEMLDEFNIPYKTGKRGLSVSNGTNVSAKLISFACDAGVRILNMAEFKDLIYVDKKIEGVVMDWSPQLSVEDDVRTSFSASLKSQVVIDATGTGAYVYQNLAKKIVLAPEKYAEIDLSTAEELLLEKTAMVYPGLAITGLAVSTVYGIAQAGLTLCSLLLSGRKVAQEVGMFFADNYTGLEKKHR